jgi:hypothetical protein
MPSNEDFQSDGNHAIKPPPSSVPAAVTMRQARLAFMVAGLLSQIEALFFVAAEL